MPIRDEIIQISGTPVHIVRSATQFGTVLEIDFDGETRSTVAFGTNLRLFLVYNVQDKRGRAYMGEPETVTMNTSQYITHKLMNGEELELRFTLDDDGVRQSARLIYKSVRLYVSRDLSFTYLSE